MIPEPAEKLKKEGKENMKKMQKPIIASPQTFKLVWIVSHMLNQGGKIYTFTTKSMLDVKVPKGKLNLLDLVFAPAQ